MLVFLFKVLIEDFVRAMIKGCTVQVASHQGKQSITCLLDADLKAMRIKAKDGSQKPIPLAPWIKKLQDQGTWRMKGSSGCLDLMDADRSNSKKLVNGHYVTDIVSVVTFLLFGLLLFTTSIL